MGISEILLIGLYSFLIILVIILIILSIKLIYSLKGFNLLVQDVTKKVKTLDTLFNFIDNIADKLDLVNNAIVGLITKVLGGLFKDKDKKKDGEKDE